MRDWASLNEDRDLGGIELCFGVVFGVPIDLDGWQMLNRIVELTFGNILDGFFVFWKKGCYCPPVE